MDLELPPRRLLDKDYVIEIVGLPIKTYSISEGSKKGDNVIGKMLCLTVETDPASNDDVEGNQNGESNEVGQTETLHLVIKSLLPLTGEVTPETMGESRLFNELKVYPTEIKFYKEVRPLLQKFTGYPPSSLPKFYSGVNDGLNDYLAMEDVRVKGYKMADKQKGLSLEEVTKVLQTIALLHAHSYSVITSGKNPSMVELQSSLLKEHIWERQIFDLDQSIFFNAIIQKCVEILRESGDGANADKMGRFVKIGHKIIMDLFHRSGESPKYFKTIIHGDLWTNNILFKHSSPTGDAPIEDVTFVDYQQCRFGNIYEDLLYFFFTSTTAEFRKNHLRTCLKSYYEEFTRILGGNNCPLPEGFTDEGLIATFYENIEYGFCYNLVGIPFQLGEQQPSPPQNKSSSPPPQDNQGQGQGGHPPSATTMALIMAEALKQGTKHSPTAMQRLKELVNEMRKLNVLC